jgi:hypothetical protein
VGHRTASKSNFPDTGDHRAILPAPVFFDFFFKKKPGSIEIPTNIYYYLILIEKNTTGDYKEKAVEQEIESPPGRYK